MAAKGVYAARVRRVRERLEQSGLDGVVVVPGPNMRYLTGVNSLLLERPFMLLLPVDGGVNLVAPTLEAGPYRECPLPMEVHDWTDSQGSAGAVKRAASAAIRGKKWGVEGKVPYLFLSKLAKATKVRFDDAEPELQSVRELKDDEEAKLLRKSAEILSKSFEAFPEFIAEGVSEMELGRRATETIYANGGTKVDDVLVQSGERAADPHALPSSKTVRRGEGIIFDIGSTFEGYYADVTRTYCVGRSPELEKVYSKVLEAEERGIGAAKRGAKVGQVDGAARGTLVRAGMGRYFIHRTGHGLGLEVHEAPYVVEGGEEKLQDGMCFTVEPGVYVRGKLGVRMEDDVFMAGGKGIQISTTPKEFGWWA